MRDYATMLKMMTLMMQDIMKLTSLHSILAWIRYIKRFRGKTRRRLTAGGWIAGHRMDIADFDTFYGIIGFTMWPVLGECLAEFGDQVLYRPLKRPPTPESAVSPFLQPEHMNWMQMLISPYLACGYMGPEAVKERCNDRFRPSLTPFAAMPGHDNLWLMNKEGQVFLITDGTCLHLIGENFDDVVESFISGDYLPKSDIDLYLREDDTNPTV